MLAQPVHGTAKSVPCVIDSQHMETPVTNATDLSNLKHHNERLPGGGEVIVLDTGASITPEATAMLGALYSRSPKSVWEHLDLIAKKGPASFMETYYVKYGHKSIGDMGNACVFFEGVSMLAAKALQDFPLYNGQEVSTRYVDFSTQPFIDPAHTAETKKLLESLRTFYLQGLEKLIPALTERFPRKEDEVEKVYNKAIKARAFDTMRAFLPAGAATSLVWVGELRQFADRIPVLRLHPLPEVRDIAAALERALMGSFPSSFSNKRYDATERYVQEMGAAFTFFDDPVPVDFELSYDGVRSDRLTEYRGALANRPPKTELPQAVRDSGMAEFRFLLDFGSYRDLQRHRAVTTRVPLLTTRHGFEPWYLDELPDDLRTEAKEFLSAYESSVTALGVDRETTQYYLPMGYRTTIRTTGDLRALVYLVELRATRFVHPTLRARATQMAHALVKLYGPHGLILHLDPDPDRFDVRRGAQDIEKR